MAGVNCIGVTRTAAATKVIVVIVIAVLALVVAGASSGAGDAPGQFLDLGEHGWYGVLQSAGLIFFAFAGYARVATMGEEVRSPQRTIPRAIVTSLGLTLLIYATIATLALMTLGPERLAASPAPLMDVASAGGWDWTRPIVRIGAAAATLGALLALIAGVGRTSLAMARNGDLPQGLAAVHPRFQVPHRAEVTLAVVVCALILLTDIRSAIGFSSFGVLLYYLIANIAAYTQGQEGRRFPRLLQVVGATGCMVLVVTLPGQSIVGGLAVLMLGIVYRVVRLLARSGPSL